MYASCLSSILRISKHHAQCAEPVPSPMFTDALLCMLVLPVYSADLTAQQQQSSGAQGLTFTSTNKAFYHYDF